MTSNRIVLPLLLVLICLTSCKLTDSLKTIRIEIMKPVDFAIPENVKTVAIFKRDFKNYTRSVDDLCKSSFVCDTLLNSEELSNYCVDGLTSFLKEENYFQKVNNYRDSMNNAPKDPYLMLKSSDLFKITQADALIFLDLFQFENGVFSFFDGTFRTRAVLSWTIIFRGNTTSPTIYNQIDTLFFSKSQFKDIQQKNRQSQQIYKDAANHLGKCFGTKIIPSWVPVDRIYYHSKNSEMLKAEKYAISQDWLKAGEIWNRQTKNKNEEIAAKACYNLALACEMEGKYDLAIDWLNHKVLTKYNEPYEVNCEQYIRVLTLRKYEIEKLGKQIGN
ncbi:MAG: DUF6340 family protein [Bacteroidia bacterium]